MDSTLGMARAIFAKPTLAERQAALDQVMPQFKALVGTSAAYYFADAICAMPQRAARQAALDEVPAELRDQVRSIVLMRFAANAELAERGMLHAGGA